tara:strand:- start:1312 stop:2160 length:849 start_codon:yes stop_codon:yes gene_type:complete
MGLIKTKRGILRQAIQAIHNPPLATDTVKASKHSQPEKAKMVKELVPFLMYLYKKHMDASITEGVDLDMMKLINKAMRQMPGSPAQKKTIQQLNMMRTSAGLTPLKEDINIPINVGDTILGGKFKNKRIVVKSIGKNEKGDITINDKPLLKFRLLTPVNIFDDIQEGTINEIPMDDLQKIDTYADKQLSPLDVVLTGKHFFDRLNDPRNGKEISQAELIGFFKRLSKYKKEFVEFLGVYSSVVASDDRTGINIPFMKQANKAIAKTVMRKKDFKSSDKKLDI